jgi:ABC-2 type transport system ATP-binding protein
MLMMTSTLPPAIEICDMQKVFGDKVAVKNLSLCVEQGEVFGFLGPNGAGKTTAVKMLLGLITPDAGGGSLLGAPLGDYRTRSRLGFLPEHFRFHEWLTASEFLKLHADLYRIPSHESRTRVPELLDLVGLASHATKKLRQFSKGMLQRIGLAQALLNQPDLVILDEPTSGLDPVGRRLVRDIISNLRQKSTTVFLNSHFLSEVEVTCDRVAFIKHGEVLQITPLNTIMEGNLSVEIRTKQLSSEAISGLARWSKNVRANDEGIVLTITSENELPEINRYLVENEVDVYAIQPQHISLEELFIKIIGTDGGL